MEPQDPAYFSVNPPPIYVVSGGAGAVGEHVARVALAQFQATNVSILIIPQVRTLEQLEKVIDTVASTRGMILHTMVDRTIRFALIRQAQEHNIVAIDLVGSVLARLTTVLGHEPLGEPGLYTQRYEANFDRLEAIEYTVDHDDGRKPHEIGLAEIVLLGVSRVGKTPLSMYLAVLGWKVANIPLIKHMEPTSELFTIDRRRVIGLTIEPEQIMARRRWRQRKMGIPLGESYTELEELYEEMEGARRLFRRYGFAIIDVTDKPIEESADEVITLITRWFKHQPTKSDDVT